MYLASVSIAENMNTADMVNTMPRNRAAVMRGLRR